MVQSDVFCHFLHLLSDSFRVVFYDISIIFSMSLHQKLRAMRKIFSEANVFPYTHGLSNNEIAVFQEDPNLNMAVTRAADVQSKLLAKYPKLFVQNEKTLSPILQKDFLQFYDPVVCVVYFFVAVACVYHFSTNLF